jgi:hypothetical protein
MRNPQDDGNDQGDVNESAKEVHAQTYGPKKKQKNR